MKQILEIKSKSEFVLAKDEKYLWIYITIGDLDTNLITQKLIAIKEPVTILELEHAFKAIIKAIQND